MDQTAGTPRVHGMCHECWSTALSAARDASSRLRVALTYFNSEQGQNELSHYRPQVAAAQGAVDGVLMRLEGRRGEGRRAHEEDVAALEEAREAFLRMSDTDAGQERPYLNFSEDQLKLARALDEIRKRWSAEPEPHATS